MSALVLVISSGIQLFANYRTQRETVFSRQQIVAQYAAQSVGGFVQENFQILETAIRLEDVSLIPAERQRQLLQSLIGARRSFRQIFLFDDKGVVLARASRISLQSSPLSELFAGESLASAKDGKRYISPVYIDPTSSEPLIIIAVPFCNVLGDFKGSLLAEVNLKFMWDLIDTLKVGETGKAYVVDRRGGLLAFGDTARVLMGENVRRLKAVEDFVGDTQFLGSSMSIYAGITGESVLGTFVPLKVPDWAVVTELPVREAYRGIGRNLLWTLLVIAAVAVSAGILGTYAARRLTVPLVHLTQTADEIASGEVELLAAVEGPREVSILATAFNSMTMELRRSIAGLEQQMAEVQRAEQSLRQANTTLQALFDHSPLAITIIDPEGCVLLWNLAAQSMYGWSAQEVLGKPLPTVPEEQADEFRVLNYRMRAGESFTNIECERQRKDGSRVYVNAALAPLKNENGNPYAFVSLGMDVTEQKRAAERVKASEATLRGVFRATPIGITFNIDRVIFSANDSMCELIGYSEEEMLGKSTRQFYETEQEFERVGRELYSGISRSGKGVVETRLRRKDGKIILVTLTSALLRAEDPAAGYVVTIEDVTERRQAEIALRESEERLRLALVVTNQGLWDLNVQTGQAQISPEYEMMIGYEPGELDVKIPAWSAALHPEDRERVVREFGDYTSCKSSEYRVEFRLRTKSGGYKWVLSTGKIVAFDEEGRPVRMVGLHADIEHRKRTEEALQRTQFCVDHSRDAVFWIASDGRFVYVNEAACEGLEYSREELLEMSVFDIDPHRSKETWDAYWKMRLGAGSTLIETEHRVSTGRTFPVEVSVNVMHFAGVTFLSSFSRDISERKKAERSLRESEYLLTKSQQVARLGSYYFDALSGKWIGSPMLDELFGIDKSYPRDTNGWIGLVHPEHKEEMRLYLEDHVISKHNMFNREYRVVRHRDGGEIWVHGLGELEFDENGNTLKMIGTIQDVTERRLAEEEVRKLNEELENRVLQRTAQFEAANKELEAFAYSVSHDLRAPLRAVDGFTRILMEDHFNSLNDEGRRVCGIISEEARRMGELIDNLLTYSRMGRVELIHGLIEMEPLANSVFHELTTDEDRKRIEFHVGQLPTALSDGTMLHHVWSNLIGNAVKFTSKRERAIIEIGADQNEKETIYYVRDNGAGFDMRYSHKLFGMFQRLHNTREFEGTGVGLAIVQRLIQRHGGRIWAWGEPDKGAAFYFTIPRQAAQC
jgi:PAS domain S-box-containing protein